MGLKTVIWQSVLVIWRDLVPYHSGIHEFLIDHLHIAYKYYGKILCINIHTHMCIFMGIKHASWWIWRFKKTENPSNLGLHRVAGFVKNPPWRFYGELNHFLVNRGSLGKSNARSHNAKPARGIPECCDNMISICLTYYDMVCIFSLHTLLAMYEVLGLSNHPLLHMEIQIWTAGTSSSK